MDFKTNFKDDIYSGNRKYVMVTNDDGTVSFVDATVYDQQGDYFGGNELNAIGQKLNGIEDNANNYVHPTSHSPAIINQDANNRFVTDTEKAAWNGKAGTGTATSSTNGLMSSADKSKLDGVASGANNYTHPSTHPASILTAGTFGATGILAQAGTDYTTTRVRNAYFSTSIPTTMNNGEICFVYE